MTDEKEKTWIDYFHYIFVDKFEWSLPVVWIIILLATQSFWWVGFIAVIPMHFLLKWMRDEKISKGKKGGKK